MSNAKKKSQNSKLKANNRIDEVNSDSHSQSSGQLDTGNLDKVRDIIFGHQMRDYEKKFARLEDRIIKLASELREDVTRRLKLVTGAS